MVVAVSKSWCRALELDVRPLIVYSEDLNLVQREVWSSPASSGRSSLSPVSCLTRVSWGLGLGSVVLCDLWWVFESCGDQLETEASHHGIPVKSSDTKASVNFRLVILHAYYNTLFPREWYCPWHHWERATDNSVLGTFLDSALCITSRGWF